MIDILIDMLNGPFKMAGLKILKHTELGHPDLVRLGQLTLLPKAPDNPLHWKMTRSSLTGLPILRKKSLERLSAVTKYT
jgi:hypothetical protein